MNPHKKVLPGLPFGLPAEQQLRITISICNYFILVQYSAAQTNLT